jgi:hypothetical protein
MAATNSGYLFIADISGYTSYLSKSELEHAQEILGILLELLIEHTRPPLVISRLAGDAVISYALQENPTQGQTFIEMIEEAYVAFRRAIELMVLNNSCECDACANVSTLDLKFFVHFGTFGLQRLGSHDELVGSDVNLIHRLLKNHVSEKTGVRAYSLYTEAALERIGLEGIRAAMTPHSEEYEHLGEVRVWVQDMHPVWEGNRLSRRIAIPDEDRLAQVETDIAMPPNLVWDYLSQPEYRKTLLGSDRQQISNLSQGRLVPGSVYQCFHGKRVTLQTILEWRPFEQITSEDLIVSGVTALVSFQLSPSETGTRLVETIGRARGPVLKRSFLNFYIGMGVKTMQRDIDSFKQQIETDLAQRRGLRLAPIKPSAEAIGEAAAQSLAASSAEV